MDWQERIVTDPKILSGQPTVRGTRLSVAFILDQLADGESEANLLAGYPQLSTDDIRACLRYAGGRLVTGAELAWGAAVHAVKYIAHQSPNLPTRSHDDVKAAVRQLDRQYPTLRPSSDFGHAEVLHRHFYRGNLQAHPVRNSWRRSQSLTANLLSLMPTP